MNICLKFLFFFILLNIIIKAYKDYTKKRVIRDVLFINGCSEKIIPHTYRYRILHQIEQLNAGNLECLDLYYLDIYPNIVLDFRIIIFYRCPWTKQVNETIKFAKSLNKKVFFDIDDLVIDTKYTDLIPYIKALPEAKKKSYNKGVILMGKTLKLCEGAITSTENLAEELKNYVKEVYVNHNVASEEMFKLSKKALEIKPSLHKQGEIVIGYFSGSISHNSDIDFLIPTFIKILQEFQNVKLFFIGELDISKDLKNFPSKIIKKKIC
jgi:glycosyltransferase involved in cell wall biosynthesis